MLSLLCGPQVWSRLPHNRLCRLGHGTQVLGPWATMPSSQPGRESGTTGSSDPSQLLRPPECPDLVMRGG